MRGLQKGSEGESASEIETVMLGNLVDCCVVFGVIMGLGVSVERKVN